MHTHDGNFTREDGAGGQAPVAFVAHGAPLLAIEPGRAAPLVRWAPVLGRPSAILLISAHWETEGIMLGSVRAHESVLYDFGRALPSALFKLDYPAPGAPELAATIEEMLAGTHRVERSERGLDHGAWVPLRVLFPAANIPVLQLSLPRAATPAELVRLGRALRPLREEGVLVLGSGNLVHNLSTLDRSETRGPAAWAVAFDEWLAARVEAWDLDALVRWQEAAPSAVLAHPTDEHLRPLFVCLGAAEGDIVRWPITGFEHGDTSRRCAQFGEWSPR